MPDMVFRIILVVSCFTSFSCKPKVKIQHDHIEEFLENKTLSDVIELNQHVQRARYLERLENEKGKLSDEGQQNLVLADGAVLPCDATWHQYSGTGCCYRTTDEKSEWYGGTELCRALHPQAQLASFHSQGESEFVCKKYSSIHAWTGLSQTETPGVWTYTDGTPDWHWFFAQSSTMTTEKSCVEMMDGVLVLLFSWSAKKGQTQPYSCTESIASICKYCPQETTSTSTSTSTTTTTIPITSTVTTTVTTTSEPPTTVTSTTSTTESTSTVTTTIPTTTTTTTVSTTVPTTKTTTETETSIKPTETTVIITTPSTTTVTTTVPTTTVTSTSSETTTTTRTTVTSTPATTPSIAASTKAPTTQKSTPTTTITTSTVKTTVPGTCTPTCPTPTVSFNDRCYKMCRGLVKFEDSCTWCNGTMVTVSSKEENSFVSRVFGSNDETTRQIWIGNTESSGYLNWSPGQPTKPNDGLDYCISMDLSAGSTRGKYKYLACQSTVINSLCVMNP
ncbi:C-type lectin domain-containing protein [Caenorhabditis elegans]|uniref:C-type lectin domain-containing protein n=1 Tax=Caenorhabditis elegans TaxID=6239 RepID=G5EFM5_CAEEL|nr:C-type lectin domain-containing protein [Caenorhabditis elegans]CAA94576.4 C-type lectin domain-containing protein [Caenorhabditis elegans]|eukprot:NP_502375.4 C-type LECtin [Caenorhabditis elegans]